VLRVDGDEVARVGHLHVIVESSACFSKDVLDARENEQRRETNHDGNDDGRETRSLVVVLAESTEETEEARHCEEALRNGKISNTRQERVERAHRDDDEIEREERSRTEVETAHKVLHRGQKVSQRARGAERRQDDLR
jgi:hypothetical protein